MTDALFDMEPAPKEPNSFEAWCEQVRPAFVEAAQAGRKFTVYQVARDRRLPEPPDPAHHWGLFTTRLRDEGLIKTAGWANSDRPTSNASAVRKWIGVTKRIENAA